MNERRRLRERARGAFRFRGGRSSLDFAGTLAARGIDPIERLKEPVDLDLWFVDAGMVDDPAGTDAAGLGAARGLREAIYGLVAARVFDAPLRRTDLREVNRWSVRPVRAPRLAGAAAERLEMELEEATPSLLLAEIARDAVELLGSPDAARVRECRNPRCSLVFLDSSRGNNRNWCSMEVCGNRSKTAVYRKKKQNGQTRARV